MALFGKKKEKSPGSDEHCPSCNLPLTDKSWLMCPRCRAVLPACGGCSACGKCGKDSSGAGGR